MRVAAIALLAQAAQDPGPAGLDPARSRRLRPWRCAAATVARAILPLLVLAAAASSAAQPSAVADSGPSRATPVGAHHRDGHFQNRYIEFEPRSLLDLLRWKRDAARLGLPAVPAQPTPRMAADLEFIAANAVAGPKAMVPAVTWVGHATVLIQVGGLNLLTDPMLSERASPLRFVGPRRQQPPGLAVGELPRIDVVLISHDHYDHCDEASLQALNRQPGGPPLFLVPLGLKAWLMARGISNVEELDWWQSHFVGPTELVFTPVQHWSGRGLTDHMKTLWGGWAVFAPDQHVFFAGDTAYSKDFIDIQRHFAARNQGAGFDLALIPIGAYEPRWFMADQHVDPVQAVRIHLDLRARQSMGIHWGTFALSDEALDRPPQDLAVARRNLELPDEAFFVLAIGQTRRLSPRAGGK